MKLCVEGTEGFTEALKACEERSATLSSDVKRDVSLIIDSVRERGDRALAELTIKFDRFDPDTKGISVSPEEMEKGYRRLDASIRGTLDKIARRIIAFHEMQRETGFTLRNDGGGSLTLVTVPVEKAGIYAPGGKAAYPSTVLMNALPARVAGVKEIYAAVPSPDGTLLDEVLGACHLAGVSTLFRIGGAQAIAAFAYGTTQVPRVDVIAGPGNVYVTEAKRQLFGTVGIDMLAGPSELVVLADSGARGEYVAYDLVSQAEHGEDTFVALVTDSKELAEEVMTLATRIIKKEKREEILTRSLMNAPVFLVEKIERGIEIVNRLAPEHLSLQVRKSGEALAHLTRAGTIFVGPYSPVAAGDYIAGINHTLPTGGSSRFSSPLGVYTFMKRYNVVAYTASSLEKDLGDIKGIAGREGLTAHGNSAAARFRNKK